MVNNSANKVAIFVLLCVVASTGAISNRQLLVQDSRRQLALANPLSDVSSLAENEAFDTADNIFETGANTLAKQITNAFDANANRKLAWSAAGSFMTNLGTTGLQDLFSAGTNSLTQGLTSAIGGKRKLQQSLQTPEDFAHVDSFGPAIQGALTGNRRRLTWGEAGSFMTNLGTTGLQDLFSAGTNSLTQGLTSAIGGKRKLQQILSAGAADFEQSILGRKLAAAGVLGTAESSAFDGVEKLFETGTNDLAEQITNAFGSDGK